MELRNQGPLRARFVILLLCLSLLAASSVWLYLYSRTHLKAWRLGLAMDPVAMGRILGRSIPALIAMFAAAALIAVLSLAFQTITQSRLLTPSMIGFDAVFVCTQTVLAFVFGAGSALFANAYFNFFISAGAMVGVSMVMYGLLLRRNRDNMVFLLMFGLVLSGVLGNGARYLQILMSPQEFMQVQAASSVTVNNLDTKLLWVALPLIGAVTLALLWRHRSYDVMSLGPQQAKSLGVEYSREVTGVLLLISLGMGVATALIGSLTFLGLLAVNIARELLKTHRHLPLFLISAMLAAVTLVLGQSLVEALQGAVPVTAIINLVGCSYLFYLILKENRL